MDRTDVAAQQARLAEYRKVQDHTKQPDRPTSAAKQIDPEGQIGKDQAPMKKDFEKAHDHAIAYSDKKEPQVSPQLRDQDAPAPAPGMNGPKPPQPPIRNTEYLEKLNEQAKARQEGMENDKLKDGKDHD